MIGPMEKGIEAARLTAPPVGSYEGVDLSTLPKYICFQAAMLRERLTFQYLIGILLAIFAIYFATSRSEIGDLHAALRRKEYILAPGVQDFTPASPHMVSDSYINHAAMEFLSQLGNINALNIDEQYKILATSMSPALRMRFESEALKWREKVKGENLSEVISILEKEIASDDLGSYQVVAKVRVDSYLNHEHIGYRDEAVEMDLRLIPPEKDKRWFLEISDLGRTSLSSYRAKQDMTNTRKEIGE